MIICDHIASENDLVKRKREGKRATALSLDSSGCGVQNGEVMPSRLYRDLTDLPTRAIIDCTRLNPCTATAGDLIHFGTLTGRI